MASCDYCGSRILFGGVKADQGRFCNDRCHTDGALIEVARAAGHEPAVRPPRQARPAHLAAQMVQQSQTAQAPRPIAP